MIQVSNVKITCQYTVQYKNQKVIQQDAKDRTKITFLQSWICTSLISSWHEVNDDDMGSKSV